jgi:hypothetical protein
MHKVHAAEGIDRYKSILNHAKVGTVEGHTGVAKLV